MPERDGLWPHVRSDEDAERVLADLGPFVLRKEQVEAEEMDPAFKRELRARLMVSAAEQERQVRPLKRVARGRLIPPWPTTVITALAAALVVALVLHGWGYGRKPSATGPPKGLPLLSPPPPAQSDLLRSSGLGVGGGGPGGAVMPEITLFDTQVAPYAGHLALSASQLPDEPRDLPAYQLAGPAFDLPRIATLAYHLGISGAPHADTSPLDNSAWMVVANGGPPAAKPLHSIAIAQHTGEMIYHNPPSGTAPSPAPALYRARAIALARRWIASLGWPATLPAQSATPDVQILPPSGGIPWKVSFSWRSAEGAQSAVTLIVLPNGQVIEARLWPPSQRRGTVPIQDAQSAWSAVQTRAVPVVVQGMGGSYSGTGTVQHVAIIEALDTGGRIPYLVPMYRFSGTVHLAGQGTYPWYALVPAMKRQH